MGDDGSTDGTGVKAAEVRGESVALLVAGIGWAPGWMLADGRDVVAVGGGGQPGGVAGGAAAASDGLDDGNSEG